MTSIMLTVTGARTQALVTGPLTSGMVGIPVTIQYDDSWEGLTKNLVCRCSGGTDSEVHRTILDVGSTAVVAHEVMQAGMLLYLGVEGYSTDGTLVIPTTWAMCGAIEKGANTGEDLSADPTLPIWGQLQEEIEQLRGASVARESFYIGPDEPAGESRPLYWLDTGMEQAPAAPEEPEKTLVGITAVYTGGEVPVGTAVSALTGITVTASYSDRSTEAVTGYTLSGTINEGSNTVTVAYQGKTAIFTVTGVAQSGGEELPDLSSFVLSEPWLTTANALSPSKPGAAQVRAGEAADAIPLTEYFSGDYDTLYAVNFRPNATDGYGWYSKWIVSRADIVYNAPTFTKIAEVSATMSAGIDRNRLRWMPLCRADILAALESTEYTSTDVCVIQQQPLDSGSKNYNMGIVWMASEPTDAQQRAIIEFFEKGGEL